MIRNIDLNGTVRTGDLVFIRLAVPLFRKVADATGSWSNHVGIVCGHDGKDWLVAESCVPMVRKRRLQDFIARSENGRFAIRRLPEGLSRVEEARLRTAVDMRLGTLYHTGFKLHSRRQFCSKFVREVLLEARGREIGTVETFAQVLANNPRTSLGFWKFWFFGFIPWQRETVTPASLLACSRLKTIAHHAA